MKHVFKPLAFILASVMLFSCFVFPVRAEMLDADTETTSNGSIISSNESTDMDTLDLILTAYLHMHSGDGVSIWPEQVVLEHKVPLYSEDGTTVAWYIEFVNGTSAIINNNKENPAVIEFGESPNQMISDILTASSNVHIVYGGPMKIYNSSNQGDLATASTGEQQNSLYSAYPELEQSNILLKTALEVCRNQAEIMAENTVRPLDSYDDYGFIRFADLPQLNCQYGQLSNLSSIRWAIGGDYMDTAELHCGAVCVTNLMLYYAVNGYANLKVGNSVDATFEEVYKAVDKGPKVEIKSGATKYCTSRGYNLRYSEVDTADEYISAINVGRPCSLLLVGTWEDAHWVTVVGWVVYGGNQKYMRIVNGWDNSSSYYYLYGTGSAPISGQQFWFN